MLNNALKWSYAFDKRNLLDQDYVLHIRTIVDCDTTQYRSIMNDGIAFIVEGLTGKIGTFLLADLWLRCHYDMTV